MVGQVGLNGLKKLSTQTQPNPTQNKISIQPNTTQHLQGVGLNSVSFIGLVSWMHTP